MTDRRAQPEAPARPAGDEGTGAGHRHGRRRRRGDVRHVPVELRVAAGDASGVLRAAAIRRRLRLAQAGAAARSPPTSPPFPGVSARRDARRRQRDARSRGARRAGDRPPGLDPGRLGGRASTICSCGADAGSSRAAATRCSRAKASSARTGSHPGDRGAGRHQRPPAPADDRRRRAVAGVHLQHPARRARARRPALRHLLDGASEALGAAFDMEGGFNDVVLTLAPGASTRRGDRAARSPARAVRRARRHSARAAALALDGRERAVAAADASASCCR